MSVDRIEGGVRGAFTTLEAVGGAVNALEREGIDPADITVFSPIPTPHLEEHIERPRSPVRWMTLIGGFLGTVTGFTLTYWTFFAWKLHVGGKPISSFPVAVVMMFELTVLLGGLFTLAGVFIFSRIPALRVKPGYDPRFSNDLFGVYVHTLGDAEAGTAERVLVEAGAEAIDDVA